jgi:hypothetical protein
VSERTVALAREAADYQRRERDALVALAWSVTGDPRSTPGAIAAARTRLEDVAPDLSRLSDDELILAEHTSTIATGHPSAGGLELAAACRRVADAIAPLPCARCASIDERDVVRVPAGSPLGALERAREAIAAVARGEVDLVVDG